ncbi:MAG: hypothetical protein JRJ60_18180 [Deltaproteobacteria bacterium]|nr:hypothetical protein [Deltaproteobacteria bacterium]
MTFHHGRKKKIEKITPDLPMPTNQSLERREKDLDNAQKTVHVHNFLCMSHRGLDAASFDRFGGVERRRNIPVTCRSGFSRDVTME